MNRKPGAAEMQTYLHIVVGISLVLVSLGCSSIGVRVNGNSYTPRYIYPGVQEDIKIARAPFRGYASKPGETFSMPLFVLPLAIVDVPLSLAVDTLCLPYDLWMVGVMGRGRAEQEWDTEQSPSCDFPKGAPEE